MTFVTSHLDDVISPIHSHLSPQCVCRMRIGVTRAKALSVGGGGGRDAAKKKADLREREGKKTIDSVARRRHVGHRIASHKGRRGFSLRTPNLIQVTLTCSLSPTNRLDFTCSPPLLRFCSI